MTKKDLDDALDAQDVAFASAAQAVTDTQADILSDLDRIAAAAQSDVPEDVSAEVQRVKDNTAKVTAVAQALATFAQSVDAKAPDATAPDAPVSGDGQTAQATNPVIPVS